MYCNQHWRQKSGAFERIFPIPSEKEIVQTQSNQGRYYDVFNARRKPKIARQDRGSALRQSPHHHEPINTPQSGKSNQYELGDVLQIPF